MNEPVLIYLDSVNWLSSLVIQHLWFYLMLIICLHEAKRYSIANTNNYKWFHVLPSNSNRNPPICPLAQPAGVVEYTDCTSAEGQHPPSNECPRYDTKQSDGEVPVMLRLWGMQSTPSLPLLPGPLWPGVVASDLWVK